MKFPVAKTLEGFSKTSDFAFNCCIIKGDSVAYRTPDQKSRLCSPRSYDYCLSLYAICILRASACMGQMRANGVPTEHPSPHLSQECVRTCVVSRYCSWTVCEAEVLTQIATHVRVLCGSNALKTDYVSSSLQYVLYHIPARTDCVPAFQVLRLRSPELA